MAADPPTFEPDCLVVGDTWQWEKTLTDFSAADFVLTYYFVELAANPKKFNIIATDNGGVHSIDEDEAATLLIEPGNYTYIGRVVGSGDSFTVITGQVEILPNLALDFTDPRQHDQIVFDALEAVLENRATSDEQQLKIADREIRLMPIDDIIKWYNFYLDKLRRVKQKERARKGLSSRRTAKISFPRPR